MKIQITDSDALRSLTTSDLSVWLRAHGWRMSDTVPGRAFRFVKIYEGEEAEVEIPASPHLRDYARRVAEVLQTLEVVEQMSQGRLFSEIQQAQVDRVRLRISADTTRDGRLPVDRGVAFFTHTYNLMMAAACSTIDKRPSFSSRRSAQATNFMRSLRYGPSEIGSYVAVIESRVAPLFQVPLDGIDASPVLAPWQLPLNGIDPEPPFERRVFLTLADGLSAADRATRDAAASSRAEPFIQGVQVGVSANLCEALADLTEAFEGGVVDVGIGWASSRPAPPVPRIHTFDASIAPLLREGARVLKERTSLAGFEVDGFIIKCESASPSTGGLVVIAATIDGQLRRVKVALDSALYAEANEAHIQERPVSVIGELVREPGGFVLNRPRDFQVRDNDGL